MASSTRRPLTSPRCRPPANCRGTFGTVPSTEIDPWYNRPKAKILPIAKTAQAHRDTGGWQWYPPRRQNPAWVDTAITKAWPELEQSVAAPIATTGKKGKRHVAELGCGHYGCVLATSRDDIVLKVTSDPSEAAFVTILLRHKLEQEGIVRYFDVRKIPGERKGRDLYAIWRESAYDVGKLFPTRFGFSKDDYDRQVLNRVKDRLMAFKGWAHDIRTWTRKTSNPWPIFESALKTLANGGHALDLVELDDREKVVIRRWPIGDTQTRITVLLRACELSAEMMANEPDGYLVGTALKDLLEAGILLADVHTDNVGRVDREDHKGAIVITDPGHAVFLKRELATEADTILDTATKTASKASDTERKEIEALAFIDRTNRAPTPGAEKRSFYAKAGLRVIAGLERRGLVMGGGGSPSAVDGSRSPFFKLSAAGARELGARRPNPAEVISFQGEKNKRALETLRARNGLAGKFMTALYKVGYPKARSNVASEKKLWAQQFERLKHQVAESLADALLAIPKKRGRNPAEVISLDARRAALVERVRKEELARETLPVFEALSKVAIQSGFDPRVAHIMDIVGAHSIAAVLGRRKGLW